MCELLERHLGAGYADRVLDEDFAAAVARIPDHELWAAHGAQKRKLVELLRQRALQQFARHGRSPDELRQVDELLDNEMLTVGFARRFATYKRADLILHDLERLKAILASAERPVQFIFAGKAHPADRPGQDLIRRISQIALAPEVQGRVTFVENYDMRIARGLVQGVDVWLNTPRRPQEASGTSGMKAAMNGVLNISVLDGWWCEGYDTAHGWAIGDAHELDSESQDQQDAEALYRLLAESVASEYYRRNESGLPVEWLRRMKLAMGSLTPRFSSSRMVREYTEKHYIPATRGELGSIASTRS
jgi:starch phosphorylase